MRRKSGERKKNHSKYVIVTENVSFALENIKISNFIFKYVGYHQNEYISRYIIYEYDFLLKQHLNRYIFMYPI